MIDPLGFIGSVKWKFAHTMAHIPHWYIVKDKLRSVKGPDVVVDRRQFDDLARHVRTYGRLGIWHNTHLHWYLHPRNHDWYYWTMGGTLSEQSVVNRAKIETLDVRYLDEIGKWTDTQRALLDKWGDNTECPECGSTDPVAQQWAGDRLIGLFCSSCRRRHL